MSDRFLKSDDTTGEIIAQSPIITSSGAGDGGKIPMTDPTTGQLDPTVVPNVTAPTQAIQATENLAAGDWINVYDAAGSRRARRALATDNTKPAHGFVKAAVTSGANGAVYFSGINDQVDATGYVAADRGKKAFLSAASAGATTKTPPNATNNTRQELGPIIEVGAKVSVDFKPQPPIKLL